MKPADNCVLVRAPIRAGQAKRGGLALTRLRQLWTVFSPPLTALLNKRPCDCPAFGDLSRSALTDRCSVRDDRSRPIVYAHPIKHSDTDADEGLCELALKVWVRLTALGSSAQVTISV